MPKNQVSLHQSILDQTLPRLLVIFTLLCLLLFVVFGLYLQQQIASRHADNIERFQTEVGQVMAEQSAQLQNLASNDLLVNSLVDFEQRSNYLPLFFQSIKLTNTNDFSVGFFDFTGELIVAKNWSLFESSKLDIDWIAKVIERNQIYTQFDHNGLVMVVPVVFSSFPEGAVMLYMPSIQPLLNPIANSGVQYLFSSNGEALVSSLYGQKPANSTLKEVLDLHDGVSFQSKWRDFTVVSLESYASAYQQVFPLFLAAIFVLASILMAGVFSARIAARKATESLQVLQNAIDETIQKDTVAEYVENPAKEPVELTKIRGSFHDLLVKLKSTSLSKATIESVINSMKEAVVVFDEHENVVLCNQALHSFLERFFVNDQVGMREGVPLVLLKKADSEGRLERTYLEEKTGEQHVIRWQASDYINQFGEKAGTVIVGEDITVQKSLEADLMLKTQAIEEADTSIVISDISQASEPVIYANKAYFELTGYQPQEIVGKNCRMLQGKDTEPEKIEALRQAIKARRNIDITLLNYRKDGLPFYNHLSLTPVKAKGQVASHYIGIQQDVTNQELTAKYLLEAKQKAEESSRLKADFLANMSHEIRTPMNGVLGMLDLLLKGNLEDEELNRAKMAKASAQNLVHIINDILDFSKIEAGKLTIENIPFSLTRLLKLTIDNFHQEAKLKGLSLQVQVDKSCGQPVSGDPTRIRQILSNLISNAIKFTESGHVRISARLEEHGLVKTKLTCSVEDTGVGIEEEKLAHIFEAFSQEDVSTTRNFGGTGLGLSICQQLCELMDGKIQVESQKGRGSTFSFLLLLDVNHSQSQVDLEPSRVPTQPLEPDEQREDFILLVEDNEINQEVVKAQLQQFNLDIASNGEMALQMLQTGEHRYRVILMDCQMPVMDGFEATKRIRAGHAGERFVDIPIVAMTANAMKGDEEKCLNAGMDDYISKPIDIDLFQAKIVHWYAKAKDGAGEV